MAGNDSSTKKLLGLSLSVYTDLFNDLDADKDGLLNASELRGFLNFLFGESVSNEHLFHFENRYLLNYGENGCLSRDKFIAILEDYDKAFGYSLDDDIAELYQYITHRVQHANLTVEMLICEIASLVPMEPVPKLINFKDVVAKSQSSTSLVSFDGFKTAVRKCFIQRDDSQLLAADGPAEVAPSPVRHPFYRDMLADKVARHERGLSREAIRNLTAQLQQELKPAGSSDAAAKEEKQRRSRAKKQREMRLVQQLDNRETPLADALSAAVERVV